VIVLIKINRAVHQKSTRYNQEMDIDAWITLIITVFAAGLLIFEILRPDLVAILTLVAIGVFGLIPINDVFSGFSSSVVITLIGIYILSASLHYTGAAYWLGTQLYRFSGSSGTRLIIATMLASAALSLFMNNVAVVGVLLPAIITLAGKAGIPVRRLMIPLAYGTILGGMSTLLTTSNLIVSSALQQAGYAPFTISDFFPIGLPAIAAGLLYLILVNQLNRQKWAEESPRNQEETYSHRMVKQYGMEEKFFIFNINPSSSLLGKSLVQLREAMHPTFQIAGILRNNRMVSSVNNKPSLLKDNDKLLIFGDEPQVEYQKLGLTVAEKNVDIQFYLNGICSLHEVSIPAHLHPHQFSSYKDIPVIQTHSLIPLAIRRQKDILLSKVFQITPLDGDTLLCFADYAALTVFKEQTGWQITQTDPNIIQKPGKWLHAFLIVILTILIAAFNILPVHLAMLGGAAFLILSGCIDKNKIYQAVDWQTIFLVGGLWPLGLAIQQSGLAEALINLINPLQFANQPWMIGGTILLLSMTFTQIIGGQVAGIISIPITISIAQAAHLDPRSLGMAAALGCSFVFLMPFSHPVNLIVTRAGNISTKEFMRIGIPFFILLFFGVLAGLHFFWGL
jgi:di/tricarboxylate transporter